MPAPDLHLLTTLTEAEKRRLFDNLKEQRKDFTYELLIYGAIWLVAPFFTNRSGKETMVEMTGYGWALVYFGLVFALMLYISYRQKLHKAVLSCQSDLKRIIITQITDKAHPWYKDGDKYYLKFSDPYLRKLWFSDFKDAKYVVGDYIHIEVSENGKQVVKIGKVTDEIVERLHARNPATSGALKPYKEVLFAKDAGESNSFKQWSSLLVPSGYRFITTIILELNVLVFLIMLFSGVSIYKPSAIDLVWWGGNVKALTIDDGQYWRLFTSIFIHSGIIHLLMNALGFILVGIILEIALGRVWFSIAYIVSGIFASLASVWWNDNAVSVGASGAIFGMYGLFLAMLVIKKKKEKFNKGMIIAVIIFTGYSLLMGLNGNTDNAAHIGGLIAGFLMGSIMARANLIPVRRKVNPQLQ